MKLQSPIPKQYRSRGKVCLINQLFGENKNRLFYGPMGHTGIDFKTKFTTKWDKMIRWFRSKGSASQGRVPILATHDGILTSHYNDDYENGIYVKIKYTENGDEYESLFWHLSEVRQFIGDSHGNGDFVKAGSVIGWGGNSGQYTTGPHLHYQLRKNGKLIDPILLFQDEVAYQKFHINTKYQRWFYKGKEYTRETIKPILTKLYADT